MRKSLNESKKVNLIIFISFIFLAASCTTGKKTVVQKQVLRGMIYDLDNTPVGSAELTLTSPDNLKFSKTVLSDMSGRFDFGELYPGTYTLTGFASGYEDINENFVFMDSRQILYVRTASNTQLLEKAYEALTENKFEEASAFIKRAESLNHSDRRTLFYEALIEFEKGNIEDSLRILFSLEKKDASDIAVLLFIADIYQYEKQDQLVALRYLKKASLFSDESFIKERIKILEKEHIENEN